ncbi:MAG: M23 family metallopeptidase [Oscillospiraceae bacterium]|nr:M23 family metallopeptidase [Oscillospiraceae bacterium]
MEKRGFYVTLAVCLAVVVGSALWARIPIEEEPQSLAVGEGPSFIQRFAEMMRTATPGPIVSPTPTPEPKWTRPVSGGILRAFSPDALIYQQTMDAWAAHSGVDLKVAAKEPILAPRDGKVAFVGQIARYGLTLEIELADGSLLRMMGLNAAYVNAGDSVREGETVAQAGGSNPSESLDAAHVHIEWIVDGKPADPSDKWK